MYRHAFGGKHAPGLARDVAERSVGVQFGVGQSLAIIRHDLHALLFLLQVRHAQQHDQHEDGQPNHVVRTT
jgi:hypothetical protein